MVSNFELELRSEAKCGFRRRCVDARETYILNDEIVVDVFVIFNSFCEIRKKNKKLVRSQHSEVTYVHSVLIHKGVSKPEG